MFNKKINKKGFTLTELIVVIVIIGILAAVLIPTLTGYIKKAKNSAAEQEAQSYITAFKSWQIETEDDKENLDSFKEYCIDLELVKNSSEADDIILFVDVKNNVFTIKSSNDLYVTWTDGSFSVSENSPSYALKNNFNENVVIDNLDSINDLLVDETTNSKVAELIVKPINDDGSVDVVVQIIDENAEPESVVTPVLEALNIIKANNGKYIKVTPIIDGQIMNYEEYIEKNQVLSNPQYAIDLDSSTTELATCIAYAVVYDENVNSSTDWDANMQDLLSSNLGSLLNENGVNILVRISDSNGEYDVEYNFTFSNAE